MAEPSEDIKTSVNVRVLYRIIGFVVVLLGLASGPSLVAANHYSAQRWVSHNKFTALEKRVEDHTKERGHNGLDRMFRIVICEQRHGESGWDNIANRCKHDLGLD